MKKYALVGVEPFTVGHGGIRKSLFGVISYMIIAIRSFGDVKEGDFGGYINSEKNLSQDGDCWVYPGGCLYGNSYITGNAKVYGSKILDHVCIGGNAILLGNNLYVGGNSTIKGSTILNIDKKYKSGIVGNSNIHLLPIKICKTLDHGNWTSCIEAETTKYLISNTLEKVEIVIL